MDLYLALMRFKKDKKLKRIRHLTKRRSGELFTITIERGDRLNKGQGE